MEPVEHDVMSRRPRRKDESIFAHGLGWMAGFQGLMIGLLTLIAYFIGSRVMAAAPGTGLISIFMMPTESANIDVYKRQAESWDNVGLLAGGPDREVSRILTALDITREAVEEDVYKRQG